MASWLDRRWVRKALAVLFVVLLMVPGYLALAVLVDTEQPGAFIGLVAVVGAYLLAYRAWWRWVGRKLEQGDDWTPWAEKGRR